MANPQPNQQALMAPPTMAALRDDRSRSERGSHPAGLADGSAQQSMASDIAIDTPDPAQMLSQNLYAAVQQNAIQGQLQAKLSLHLHQNDRSQDVEQIADLMHQQALAQQRANMEMQAYEQMTHWQQLANHEHQQNLNRVEQEAYAQLQASQQQAREANAEATQQLTATALRENQLLQSIQEQNAIIAQLRQTNESQARRYVEQERQLRELRDAVQRFSAGATGSERVPEGKAGLDAEPELIPDGDYSPTNRRPMPTPQGGDISSEPSEDGDRGRGRKLKKDRKKKKKHQKKKGKKERHGSSGGPALRALHHPPCRVRHLRRSVELSDVFGRHWRPKALDLVRVRRLIRF